MSVPAPTIPASWRALRSLMFTLDAERAHRLAMFGLSQYARFAGPPSSRDVARAPDLAREVMGLRFPNPVGLAAGFDKDAECVPAWPALGFGFVEVGTVTWHAQPGNPKPRIFRLPDDGALLNRLGFNNHGADAMARRMERWRASSKLDVPVGVNLGKSKITPNDEAAEDYRKSFERTADLADYVVVNVSSPNTPGLRDLQAEEELAKILDALADANAKRETPRPLVLKIAPDLDDDSALSAMRVATERDFSGLIVSNTTISREGLKGPVPDGPGGISGRPLFARSTELLRLVAKENAGRLALIGVGGIFDAADAQAKLDAGADLVQVYTGFIYGGPGFVRRLLRGLLAGASWTSNDATPS
jgi:dihydroorotate dehydrogenase